MCLHLNVVKFDLEVCVSKTESIDKEHILMNLTRMNSGAMFSLK